MDVDLSFPAGTIPGDVINSPQCFTFDPIDDTTPESTEDLNVMASVAFSDSQEVSFTSGRDIALINILDDDGGKSLERVRSCTGSG